MENSKLEKETQEETSVVEKEKGPKLTKTLRIILCVVALLLGITAVVLAAVFHIVLDAANLDAVTYVVNIFGSIAIFVGLCFLYSLVAKVEHKLTTKQMTLIAIMSAITVILYFFVKFNLPFFPPWLDIQVSELPALITGFAYGPYAGCLVILIRFLVKLPQTITAGVGEFADLILGVVLVIITSLIYRKHKTIKGALVGTALGVGVCTVLACVLNWLVLIPAYIELAKFPLEALVGMMNYIPGITVTADNFMLVYIFIGVLPFNLFRYLIVGLLTFLLYKKTHIVLSKLAG